MIRPAALATLGLLFACACAREKAEDARPLASGDAVWLSDGAGPDPTGLEDTLIRAGFSAVYLPAREIRSEGERVGASAAEPPATPLTRIPVVLVVRAAEPFAVTLRTATGPGRQALADSVGRVVQAAIADRPRFGNVTGVHLDLPFTAEALDGYAEVVRSVRRQLLGPYRLTASLRIAPGEAEREALAGMELDGWTVSVFGEPGSADPVSVDTLDKPWWAVYSPGAHGVVHAVNGSTRAELPEKYLSILSDRPDVDLTHDLTWKEEWASAYLLRPRASFRSNGESFAAGELIRFSHPSVPELLSRLGGDIAARRNARGRIILLRGSTDADRIFTLSTLADVLLGRSLEPDIRVAVGPAGGRQVALGAQNTTSHATVVSRTANWVEVDLPEPGVRDVQPGGFERYEAYDAEERPVTLGRAKRLRFYETLFAPFERVEPARVTLGSAPPAGCCRWRARYIAASGSELSSDWAAPEPTPSATPARTP